MPKPVLLLLLFFCGLSTFAQKSNKDSLTSATLLTEARASFFSDRPSSLTKSLTGLDIAQRIGDKSLQGNFCNLLGLIYSYQANYDLSLQYLNRALVFANDTKDRLLTAKVYSNRGLNYMQQGNQLKAIDESLKAAKILTAIKDIGGIGNIYANISNSYYNINLPDKALAYCDSALRYFKLANQQLGIANIYNTYGVIYSDRKQNVKALQFYAKSMAIKKAANDFTGQANALSNMGTAYMDLKMFDKALMSFKQAAVIYKKSNDAKGLGGVLANMANLKTLQDDTTALADAKTAYKYAKEHTTIEQQRDLAFNVAGKYRDRKDYKNSLIYFAIYDSLRDKTLNSALTRQITEVETRYQTERKQQQIKILNEQSKTQRLEIDKRNNTIIAIIILFGVALIIGYQQYSRNKLKQAAALQAEVIKQQDIATKGIIEAEERERKRIAGELHDGVGQLFTTVKMNMEILIERFLVKKADAAILAEKTMAMVDESCTEVRSIAHQMMPNALIKSGLVTALRDFINKIPSEKLKISMDIKGIDKDLESTTETVLYRVIQESVNNVIKHAEATALDILLLCDNKEITVSIEDNGKGFIATDKSKFAGVGLKNMISRVEFLKGTVDISSAPGKGTLVAIYIPIG